MCPERKRNEGKTNKCGGIEGGIEGGLEGPLHRMKPMMTTTYQRQHCHVTAPVTFTDGKAPQISRALLQQAPGVLRLGTMGHTNSSTEATNADLLIMTPKGTALISTSS